MFLQRFILALTAVATVSCGGNSTPTGPTPPGTPTVPVMSWVTEGVRLTDVTAGFPGSVLANVSAFRLNDGRYRVLMTAGFDPTGIRTAVTTDGLTWTMEPGAKIGSSGDCGHVRAFRLDDGGVRVYCRNASGILSYISTDEAQTLTREGSGLMITNGQVGAARLSTGGIVRTTDGRWRMYFSDDSAPGSSANAPQMKIFSAVSTDLLSWTVETGVRIGAGATASGSATHPSAITNADGSVSVAYTRFSYPGATNPASTGVWIASSSDGLTFTSDVWTGLPGFDPDIVQMSGTTRIFYNIGDSNSGAIYSARLSSGSMFLQPMR